jgi:hypothetical protein
MMSSVVITFLKCFMPPTKANRALVINLLTVLHLQILNCNHIVTAVYLSTTLLYIQGVDDKLGQTLWQHSKQ